MRPFRIEPHLERIPTSQHLIAQRGLAYLAFFSGSGYRPTPPNPNVVGYASWAFDLSRLDDDYIPASYQEPNSLELFLLPSTVTVPNVVGLPVQNALSALGNVFLNGTVTLLDLPLSTPYNTVATQSIAAGTQVGQGTIVNLTAQDLTVVPAVIGLQLADAVTAISAAFLASSTVEQVSVLLPGTVIAQDPLPGVGLLANSVVTLTVAISGDGFRVQAVTAGWYGGTYYNVGDVFDLQQASDFSDATLNYEIAGAEYTAGWMIQSAAPLTQDDGTATFPAVDPNRRFVD